MKKILMLSFLMIILTGCSANVNLTITSSTIEEEVIVNAYSDSTKTKEQVYSSFRKNIPAFINSPFSDTEPDVQQPGVKYYSRREQDLGSGYSFNYSYKFNFDEYKNARTVSLGFDSKTIQRNSVDKNIMISTDSSGLNYFDLYSSLDSVTINIKTPYTVLENNADIVNGNVYSWILRKGTKKSIYMLIDDPNAEVPSSENNDDKKEEVEDTKKEQVYVPKKEEESAIVEFFNEHPILIGIVAILAFFIIVLVVAKVSKIKY